MREIKVRDVVSSLLVRFDTKFLELFGSEKYSPPSKLFRFLEYGETALKDEKKVNFEVCKQEIRSTAFIEIIMATKTVKVVEQDVRVTFAGTLSNLGKNIESSFILANNFDFRWDVWPFHGDEPSQSD